MAEVKGGSFAPGIQKIWDGVWLQHHLQIQK
jgi:hypothetical protein